jgi:hypothetical protein
LRRKNPKKCRLPTSIATKPTSIANAPEKIKNPFTVVSFVVLIMFLFDTMQCRRGEGCSQRLGPSGGYLTEQVLCHDSSQVIWLQPMPWARTRRRRRDRFASMVTATPGLLHASGRAKSTPRQTLPSTPQALTRSVHP